MRQQRTDRRAAVTKRAKMEDGGTEARRGKRSDG